jgi:hypothetical protein
MQLQKAIRIRDDPQARSNRRNVESLSGVETAAEEFAEKLASSTSGAEALTEKRLYRSAESAAPPKSEFFNTLVKPYALG